MPRSSLLSSPSGYLVDGGNRVIAEYRQCAHCQFTWEYAPGSGNRRGVCLKCMGLLCGGAKCLAGCVPIRAILRGGDMGYEMSNGVMVKR